MPTRRPKPVASAPSSLQEKDGPRLEKSRQQQSKDTNKGIDGPRRSPSMPLPKQADSGIPKHQTASFEQLLNQLETVLLQMKVWGQQEGFSTGASQVECAATGGKPKQTKVESCPGTVTDVQTQEPEQAKSEMSLKDVTIVCDVDRADGQPPKDMELQLCDVWESTGCEAFEPIQVATPHGRLQRLSDRSFFGNVRGHETEAWKTALNRRRRNSKGDEPVLHWTSWLMLTPYSKWRAVWEVLGATLLVWDMFFIPFQTFLPDDPDHAAIDILEVCSIVYWSLDVLASFCVGFYRTDGMVEMRAGAIAKNYLTTWFMYDIVCVCTDYVLHFSKDAAPTAALIRGFRMLRLLRILKLHKRMRNSIRHIQSNQILIILHIAKNISLVLVANHVIACGWHWTGKKYHLSSASWVDEWLQVDTVDGEPEERSLSYRYFTSLHWAITQLGVGAVEIHPMNSAERLFAVLVGIGALIMSSVLVSSVTTSMVQLQELHRQEAQEDQALRQYLHSRGISQRLQGHIWAFLRKARKQDKGGGIMDNDVVSIARLPSHMSLALRMEVYMPTVIHHPFFSKQFTEIGTGGSHGKTTRDLIGLLHEIKVNNEEDLFRTGDKATKMQFVAVGEVLYKSRLDTDTNGTRIGSHDWLAEQALWLKWVHVGRAVAMQVCEMFVLDAHRFQKVMVNERSAKLYAFLFLQRIMRMSEPVTDVMGTKDRIKEWQNEISLLAFNIKCSEASSKSSIDVEST